MKKLNTAERTLAEMAESMAKVDRLAVTVCASAVIVLAGIAVFLAVIQ